MDSITARACAKINWGLRITGSQGGYHALDMAFDTVSLADVLTLTATGGGISLTGDLSGVPMEKNLAYRAAALMQERFGTEQGVEIHLEKHIPSGAGLAGGSTDGAAVLRSLNSLWGINAPVEELLPLAEKLGSDVPYCLLGGRRRAQGRGELLSEELAGKAYNLVLAMGENSLSTAAVFAEYDRLGSKAPEYGIDRLLEALSAGDLQELSAILPKMNDLTAPAVSLLPDVKANLRLMKDSGALCSFMTGSGACVVGLFESKPSAIKGAEKLKKQLPFVETVTTIHAV